MKRNTQQKPANWASTKKTAVC